MGLNKIYNLGYLVYVLALVIAYFLVPTEHMFLAILILTIFYGVFNFIVTAKYSHERKK